MADDPIDYEVRALFRRLDALIGGQIDLRGVINEASRSVEPEAVDRAIQLLLKHEETILRDPKLVREALELAAIQMLQVPGFRLALSLETERLGKEPTFREYFCLIVRLFSGLNQ